MSLTMKSELPNYCITYNSYFNTIEGIQGKPEAENLLRNLKMHMHRNTGNRMRFTKLQRSDQLKVIRLLKKRIHRLPSNTVRILELSNHSGKDSGMYRLQGSVATPERSSPARPDPRFHLEINGAHNRPSGRIELTISKSEGYYHDLIHSEEVFASKGKNDSMEKCLARGIEVLSSYNIKLMQHI